MRRRVGLRAGSERVGAAPVQRDVRTQPDERALRRSRACGLVLTLVTLLAGLTGCDSPVRPDQPARSPSPVRVRVPSDGLTLKQIGFTNGPADAFSLPRRVVITTSVDQPSGVTLVLGSPSPAELTRYLRRALPETGFVITAVDAATTTLTFTGYGWHGSFTGTGETSAVILRP